MKRRVLFQYCMSIVGTAIVLGALGFAVACRSDVAAIPEGGHDVVIYSTGAADDAPTPSPLLQRLRAEGWEFVTNPVSTGMGRERDDATALIARVQHLKAEGYRRVVLMGVGVGGWVSLLANSSFQSPENGSGIYAVIAFDANAAGAVGADRRLQHYKFINVLKTQDPTRLALVVYEADPDDAETLAAELPLIVAVRTPLFHVTVEPKLASAAEGPRSSAFAERYGPCVLALLTPETRAVPAGCRR